MKDIQAQKKTGVGMDTERLGLLKNLFLGMLEELENKSYDTEKLVETTGDDVVDLSQEERERNLSIKLRGRDKFYAKKIELALFKIENGTFGTCLDCGEEIEYRRLLARPTANYCITCKEEREREEDHVPYQKKSHTLGRTFANDNVDKIPVKTDEVLHEKVIRFNRNRLSAHAFEV
ncbi:MAG: TraR/DksA family transcriptional regulator [Bacteriovoracaceae bacterium]|nr:TraR/DksA family transcriptional regulator [Bacteriovoracaceae bacterium]